MLDGVQVKPDVDPRSVKVTEPAVETALAATQSALEDQVGSLEGLVKRAENIADAMFGEEPARTEKPVGTNRISAGGGFGEVARLLNQVESLTDDLDSALRRLAK